MWLLRPPLRHPLPLPWAILRDDLPQHLLLLVRPPLGSRLARPLARPRLLAAHPLLLTGAPCSERLNLAQRLMINPMVCTVANELAAATDAAITRHTDESASEVLEPIQRAAASKKAAYQQATRAALGRILQAPEDYILVAAQPLQSFPCLDALDADFGRRLPLSEGLGLGTGLFRSAARGVPFEQRVGLGFDPPF